MQIILRRNFFGSPSRKNTWSVSPQSHSQTRSGRTFCQDASLPKESDLAKWWLQQGEGLLPNGLPCLVFFTIKFQEKFNLFHQYVGGAGCFSQLCAYNQNKDIFYFNISLVLYVCPPWKVTEKGQSLTLIPPMTYILIIRYLSKLGSCFIIFI